MYKLLLFFFQPDGPAQTTLPLVTPNGPVGELFRQFSTFFPRLVGALVILLIGWIVARTLRNILRQVLAKLDIDRFADMLNDIDIVRRSGLQISISKIFSQIVYYILMLIFIIAATDAMGVQPVTLLVSQALNYIPALFSAIVVFMLGLFVANMIRGAVQTVCLSLGIPAARLIASAVFYFLLVTVVISALTQARINTDFISSNLTVLIGCAALAFAFGYGLASRDLMASYLAGYYNKNKVRVGDDVRIIGVRGKVVLIDANSLILQTADRAIIIPLGKLTTEKIEVFYPDGQEENLLNP